MPYFGYKGSNDTYTLEANKTYLLECFGAGAGGNGGYVQAVWNHTANTTAYIYVGESPNGSHVQESQWHTAKYNGGGAGGNAYEADGSWRRGQAGGGATDIRTSTSTSARIMVAGGGGGNGGSGGSGGSAGMEFGTAFSGSQEMPVLEFNTDGDRDAGGGAPGTSSAAGAGGSASSYKSGVDANDGTYYISGGGGGGGGYFGGGGGGTNTIQVAGSTYAGVAGSAGSAGTGGAGGAKTTGVSGWSPAMNCGGGGGGSSWISNSPYLTRHLYSSSGHIDNGSAEIYEIKTKPKIKSIEKDGNRILATIEKSDTAFTTEEKYFFSSGVTPVIPPAYNNHNKAFIISDKEYVLAFTIDSKLSPGYHTFSLIVNNGIGEFDCIQLNFEWNTQKPTLTFNDNSFLNCIQGSSVSHAFQGQVANSDIPCVYEYQLFINNIRINQVYESEDNSIFLPKIYDGLSNETYLLTVKARAGQVATGAHGIGKMIWGDWVTSKQFEAIAPAIPANSIKFKTPLSSMLIENNSKILLEWEVVDGYSLTENDSLTLMLMDKSNNIINEWNCNIDMSKEIVLTLPQGDGYKFGMTVEKFQKYLSTIVYSEEFKVLSINTGGQIITVDNQLNIVTNIAEDFDHLEVHLNNKIWLIGDKGENIANTKIPINILKGGMNVIQIYIYVDSNMYGIHTFYANLNVNLSDIKPIETHIFNSYIKLNNGMDSKVATKEAQVADEFIVESEFEGNLVGQSIVNKIEQRLTINKKESLPFDLKILSISGAIK